MRPYEVMVIFDAGAEPPAIQAVVDRVLETVRAGGGSPGPVERWGRRSFAYEVNHKREGYYVLVEMTAEVQTVSGLDRMLSLADEVLRHKVIRLPDGVAGRRRAGPRGQAPVPAAAPTPAAAAATPLPAAAPAPTATAPPPAAEAPTTQAAG
jgi:small subunit ribosomal protein S6